MVFNVFAFGVVPVVCCCYSFDSFIVGFVVLLLLSLLFSFLFIGVSLVAVRLAV